MLCRLWNLILLYKMTNEKPETLTLEEIFCIMGVMMLRGEERRE